MVYHAYFCMSSTINHEEAPRYSYLNQDNGCIAAGLRIRDGLCNVLRKRLRNSYSKSINL
ncbi:conserved hypothetical protein [Chryseobacterium sp. IT-36CA2]